MNDELPFAEFLIRIRAGDDEAARELVRRYEPVIRREVRLRIGDDRLNRAFDSVDVSQSVLASFFTRAVAGNYKIDQFEQLTMLLVTMARNKLASRARSERRLIRDARRLSAEMDVLEKVVDAGPSPSEYLARHEEIELLKSALSDEERTIYELRIEGLSWDEIAACLGGNGHARRMQFSRGLERAERQLDGSKGVETRTTSARC
jgi:RNA polymerase sigma factor (sigma-70 family)